MKYESCHDENIDGYDITIYTHENKTCTLDIKYPCGEMIAGWDLLKDFEEAKNMAQLYIYSLGKYSKEHCTDERCEIMRKSDFVGFHNSFNAYCEWCETSTHKMSWGEWWENLPS